MKLPDAIQVAVLSSDYMDPIENVAVGLILYASKKNNYTIGPLITNTEGIVLFSHTGCIRSIERAKEMFPMDYTSDLNECRNYIDICLWPPQYIMQMIHQYEATPKFWGKAFENPVVFFSALSKVRNVEYAPNCLRIDEAGQPTLLNVTLILRRKLG